MLILMPITIYQGCTDMICRICVLMQVVDGGWWEGTINGKYGWFPSNYVQEISSSKYSSHFLSFHWFSSTLFLWFSSLLKTQVLNPKSLKILGIGFRPFRFSVLPFYHYFWVEFLVDSPSCASRVFPHVLLFSFL